MTKQIPRKENQALCKTQDSIVVCVTQTVSRGVITSLEIEPSSKNHKEAFVSKANDIKEGSLVEVGDLAMIFSIL